MKLREKTTTLLIAIFMISMMAAVSVMAKKGGTTIQDGILTDTHGNLLVLGYDAYGYNYQGHMFNGWYHNVGRPPVPWTEASLIAAGKSTTWLVMKWNDAWLSNMDCDGDGKLDRPSPVIGSGAWETNHQRGTNPDGSRWYYFCKIVAVPTTAVWKDNDGDGLKTKYIDTWETPSGVLIGQMIWSSYAITFKVSNDPSVPEHGVLYNPPAPTGFGCYK